MRSSTIRVRYRPTLGDNSRVQDLLVCRPARSRHGSRCTPVICMLLLYGCAQFSRGRPRRAAVDHAVAVGTYESEVSESGPTFAGLMQGHYVVTLDVPPSTVAVDQLEIKAARLASKLPSLTQRTIDLLLTQRPVPLPAPVTAEQQLALGRAEIILLLGIRKKILEFSGHKTMTDTPGHFRHLIRPGEEFVHDFDVKDVSVRRLPRIARMPGRDIDRFASYAVRIPK